MMSAGDIIIAIDIGTTGTKAALIDRAGHLLATGYADYPTHTAAGGVMEQNPQDWWRATCNALTQVWQSAPPQSAARVAAVSLSGQMQDLILLGADGAIGQAILYSDSRAQAEAARVVAKIGQAELMRITGNEQGAGSLLAKWLWLQTHEPARLAACRKILVGAHEYIGWQLYGAAGADYTTASTTGLFDLNENRWSFTLLDALGLDADKLPGLHAATSVQGEVTAAASAATGIPAGTPIFRGAGDLAATTVGVGAGEPGRLYCYLGTSGWIAASLEQATPQPEAGVFTLRHPDPQRYIQVAPMLTAGGNVEWWRGVRGEWRVAKDGESAQWTPTSYEQITLQAMSASAGSGGVIYLPYLAGERSPFSDPNARGAFVGLSTRTTQAEMVRAVLEGVAFAYRSLREALGIEQSGPLYMVGGGARSPIWPQILADVLACPVQVVGSPGDAAARGAAILAGVGLGWYSAFTPGDEFFPVAKHFEPSAAVALYDAIYPVFRTLYPQLRGAFAALTDIPYEISISE